MLMQYYDRYLLAERAEEQTDSSAFDSGCSFFVSVNPRRNRGKWVNVTGEDRTNYGWRDFYLLPLVDVIYSTVLLRL